MIDWKAVAHHQRHLRRLSENLEITLKRRLGIERTRRLALVSQMSDLMMDLAYDEDDIECTYCRICQRNLSEERGHSNRCRYVRAMQYLAEAGRSTTD